MFTPCSCLILFMLMNPLSGQTFHRLASKEYHIEVKSYVRSYSEAVDECAQINATLAIVNSQAIRDFLVNNIGNLTGSPHRFFIGLTRINSNNTNDAFQWIDGTLLSSGSNYSDWERGEPNNQPSGEDCVTIGFEDFLDHNWIDVSCMAGQYRYICERNINENLKTPNTTENPENRSTGNALVIALVTVGGLLFLIALIVLVMVMRKKCNSKTNTQDSTNQRADHGNYLDENLGTFSSIENTYEDPIQPQKQLNSNTQSDTRQVTDVYAVVHKKPQENGSENDYAKLEVTNGGNTNNSDEMYDSLNPGR